MVRIVIANAFSLSMLRYSDILIVTKVPLEVAREVIKIYEYTSIVGHESTAQILSSLLDAEIKVNRVQYTLEPNDVLLVFQLLIRLQEGKVLSSEELEALVKEGKATFYMVGPINAFWEMKTFTGPEAWYEKTELTTFLQERRVSVPKP